MERTSRIERQYYPGSRINNRYQVLKSVQGGMGIVYLCFDTVCNMPVAVKTILPEFFRKTDAVQKFRQEALVWVELGKHPNIVNALYLEDIDNQPAVIMECINGDESYGNDLSCYIGRCHFELDQIIDLAIQFCEGMIHAGDCFEKKGKPFVHRDIKPQNIMLMESFVLKIADFGLVKNSYGDRIWGGTPGYMSPEQYEGKEVDAGSDIYSFGCVFFELLSEGVKPYNLSEKEIETVNPQRYGEILQQKHLSAKPIDILPLLSANGLEKEIAKIVSKCIEREKNKRYRSFSELQDELKNIYLKLCGQRYQAPSKTEMDVDEIISRADSYYKFDKYDEAMELINKALSLVPGYGRALHQKALIIRKLGQPDEALFLFDQAIEVIPNFYLAWVNKGVTLMTMGNLAEAINCFDQALTINPKSCGALASKADVFSLQKRLDESIALCHQAIKIDSKYYQAWLTLGNAYLNMENYSEALSALNSGLEWMPDCDALYNSIGAVYFRMGKYEEALPYFEKAISLNPRYANALNNMGSTYVKLGDIEKAMGYYFLAAAFGHRQAEKILQVKGLNTAEGWTSQGQDYIIQAKFEPALVCLQKAVSLEQEYDPAWFYLGIAFDNMDQQEDAVNCFNITAGLGNPKAMEILRKVEKR